MKLILGLGIVMGWQLLSACVTHTREPLIGITEESVRFDLETSPAVEQLRRLQAVTAKDEGWRLAVQDISLALDARIAEDQQDWDRAGKAWLQVLNYDPPMIGPTALKQWVLAHDKLMGSATGADVLARLLLATTRDGQTSPWLQKQNLTRMDRLTARIQELRRAPGTPSDIIWPTDPSAIANDPFWNKAAEMATGRNLPDTWLRWVRSLSPARRDYWEGLLAFKRKDYKSSALSMQEALPLLERDEETEVLAISAVDVLVQSQRRLGQREEAAAAYRWQLKLMERVQLGPERFAWTRFELLEKQIDAALWVGRMQAMLGDYQNARIALQSGVDRINRAYASGGDWTKTQRVQLDEWKADAYHILASRIAYEQKDYTGALAFNRVAQEMSELSREWRRRLGWSEAWYRYMQGDRVGAIRVWQSLLQDEKEEGQIPRLLFWIGRAFEESGERSDADDYFERLRSDYPLNYYHVIALPRLRPQYRWSEGLELDGVKERLQRKRAFDVERYQADPEAMRRLLRLEILIAARIKEWTSPAAGELYRYVAQKGDLLRETEATLYVTRLLHMAGEHAEAISLTAQLFTGRSGLWDDYPEQLLVFFPRPYLAAYQRTSGQHYLEPELPMAISRQESSFQSEVISPAEAIGLMQLIVPTAERQAGRLNLKSTDMAQDLKKPEFNISLGTSYLADLGRRYRGQWPQAFAAYNAGEFAVDAWLARRNAADPVVWTEALSFGETSSYVKNVWRNWEVYRFLRSAR